MGTILLNVGTLLEDERDYDPKLIQYFVDIKDATADALVELNNLLMAGRPPKLDKSLYNAQELFKDIMVPMIRQAKAKWIRCTESHPDADLQVLADEEKMKQVLANFFDNSVYAIEERQRTDESFAHGQGEIILSVYKVDDFLEITWEDNGCGIAEDDSSQIFDAFFTKKEAVGGTGLGLHYNRNVILEHRGAIWVESTQGERTRFTFRIPIWQGDEPPD